MLHVFHQYGTLPMQVSFSGQAVVFVVRTSRHSLSVIAGALTYIAFFLAQVRMPYCAIVKIPSVRIWLVSAEVFASSLAQPRILKAGAGVISVDLYQALLMCVQRFPPHDLNLMNFGADWCAADCRAGLRRICDAGLRCERLPVLPLQQRQKGVRVR